MTIARGAVGASSSLSYCAETSFGVPPVSPAMLAMRTQIGSKLDLARSTFPSKELTSTRQTMALTYGNRTGSGSFPFEFSYSTFDDFMEALFGGTWTGNVL